MALNSIELNLCIWALFLCYPQFYRVKKWPSLEGGWSQHFSTIKSHPPRYPLNTNPDTWPIYLGLTIFPSNKYGLCSCVFLSAYWMVIGFCAFVGQHPMHQWMKVAEPARLLEEDADQENTLESLDSRQSTRPLGCLFKPQEWEQLWNKH